MVRGNVAAIDATDGMLSEIATSPGSNGLRPLLCPLDAPVQGCRLHAGTLLMLDGEGGSMWPWVVIVFENGFYAIQQGSGVVRSFAWSPFSDVKACGDVERARTVIDPEVASPSKSDHHCKVVEEEEDRAFFLLSMPLHQLGFVFATTGSNADEDRKAWVAAISRAVRTHAARMLNRRPIEVWPRLGAPHTAMRILAGYLLHYGRGIPHLGGAGVEPAVFPLFCELRAHANSAARFAMYADENCEEIVDAIIITAALPIFDSDGSAASTFHLAGHRFCARSREEKSLWLRAIQNVCVKLINDAPEPSEEELDSYRNAVLERAAELDIDGVRSVGEQAVNSIVSRDLFENGIARTSREATADRECSSSSDGAEAVGCVGVCRTDTYNLTTAVPGQENSAKHLGLDTMFSGLVSTPTTSPAPTTSGEWMSDSSCSDDVSSESTIESTVDCAFEDRRRNTTRCGQSTDSDGEAGVVRRPMPPTPRSLNDDDYPPPPPPLVAPALSPHQMAASELPFVGAERRPLIDGVCGATAVVSNPSINPIGCSDAAPMTVEAVRAHRGDVAPSGFDAHGEPAQDIDRSRDDAPRNEISESTTPCDVQSGRLADVITRISADGAVADTLERNSDEGIGGVEVASRAASPLDTEHLSDDCITLGKADIANMELSSFSVFNGREITGDLICAEDEALPIVPPFSQPVSCGGDLLTSGSCSDPIRLMQRPGGQPTSPSRLPRASALAASDRPRRGRSSRRSLTEASPGRLIRGIFVESGSQLNSPERSGSLCPESMVVLPRSQGQTIEDEDCDSLISI
eukprot:TRINITY_DN35264_c0_g1_i1.p1 TRINITY_DN35264_c0_g1~~TRINITY_DN35264_c0_g1_i1.p1  ORF type:complete len:909 (+),score=125.56 TRINITY_DN35264_c0_g1_i1:318-2729(+)